MTMKNNRLSVISTIVGFATNAFCMLSSIFIGVCGVLSIEYPYWCYYSYSFSYYYYSSSSEYKCGMNDGDVLGVIMIIVAVLIFLLNVLSLVTKIINLKKPVSQATAILTVSQPINVPETSDEKYEKIAKLNEFVQSGIITKEEFEAKKKELLNL